MEIKIYRDQTPEVEISRGPTGRDLKALHLNFTPPDFKSQEL